MLMSMRRVVVAVFCLVTCHVFAIDQSAANKWLALSDQARATIEPSGVYGTFELAQLQMLQALSYGKLGNVEETLRRLPFSRGDEDWTSGGDGMIRTLVAGETLRDIHLALFRALAANNDFQGVGHYLARLNPNQQSLDIYFDLGYVFGSSAVSNDLRGDQLAQFQIGTVRRAIQSKDDQAALRLLNSITADDQALVLDQQAQLLMLSGAWVEVAQLYRLGLDADIVDAALLVDAIGMTVRAGSLDTAIELLDLVGDKANENHLVQIAMAYTQHDLARAKEVFDRAQSKTHRSWEVVALQIGADDWLKRYYAGLDDPWRRAERFYQFAKRQLESGASEDAEQSALLAAMAVNEIDAGQTRALALQLLTEYYALAGKPAEVKKFAEQIGKEETLARYRHEAQVQLAIAWANSGNPKGAKQAAMSIDDIPFRLQGLTQAAHVLHASDMPAYQDLIALARDQCQFIKTDAEKNQAWTAVLKVQLRLGDSAGAGKTVTLAANAGASDAAFTALANHYMTENAFPQAVTAAMQLPEDDQFQRQKVLGEIVKAAAQAGETDLAVDALAMINQIHIKELTMPTLAQALVKAGRSTEAASLIEGVFRSDARGNILSVLLGTYSAQGELPVSSLLDHVPKRGGAALCFAAAATASVTPAMMDQWLAELREPRCQAFAAAGAAYGNLGLAESGDVYSLVDPVRTMERVGTGMQRSAVFQRRR